MFSILGLLNIFIVRTKCLKNHPQAMECKFGRQRDDISLPCIVIPKESGHCKCNECHALKKFKRGAKTELQISIADKLMQEHLDVCARERIQVWGLFQACADFKQEHIGIQGSCQKIKSQNPRILTSNPMSSTTKFGS